MLVMECFSQSVEFASVIYCCHGHWSSLIYSESKVSLVVYCACGLFRSFWTGGTGRRVCCVHVGLVRDECCVKPDC